MSFVDFSSKAAGALPAGYMENGLTFDAGTLFIKEFAAIPINALNVSSVGGLRVSMDNLASLTLLKLLALEPVNAEALDDDGNVVDSALIAQSQKPQGVYLESQVKNIRRVRLYDALGPVGLISVRTLS